MLSFPESIYVTAEFIYQLPNENLTRIVERYLEVFENTFGALQLSSTFETGVLSAQEACTVTFVNDFIM